MTVRLHTPPKGASFARAIMALCAAKGDAGLAVAIATRRWGSAERPALILKACGQGGRVGLQHEVDDILLRAAIGAGGLGASSSWGDELGFMAAAAELIEAVRAESIIGRLQGIRKVPLNCHTAFQTTKPSAYWTGEGKGKAVSKFALLAASLPPLKIASICVLSDSLVDHSDPVAEEFVRREIIKSLVEQFDTSFVDPSNSGVTDVTPPSITSGITPIAAGPNLTESLKDVVNDFQGDASRAVWIGRPEVFTAFAGADHPNVGMRGGELLGAPALASKAAPEEALILVDPGLVFFGERETEVRISREASIEMLDGSLTQDSLSGAGASLVSCYQCNLTAVLAEHTINWAAQTGAVSWINEIGLGS